MGVPSEEASGTASGSAPGAVPAPDVAPTSGISSASGPASCGAATAAGTATGVVGVTRQMVFDRSPATISSPRGSPGTPPGGPRVLPHAPGKPHRDSTGQPA